MLCLVARLVGCLHHRGNVIDHAFHTRHAEDWIVLSAIRSDHHPGHVETIATRGGERGPSIEERRFLVPASDYDPGRFGFVIDPVQHGVYDGPSSFVGWGR